MLDYYRRVKSQLLAPMGESGFCSYRLQPLLLYSLDLGLSVDGFQLGGFLIHDDVFYRFLLLFFDRGGSGGPL